MTTNGEIEILEEVNNDYDTDVMGEVSRTVEQGDSPCLAVEP